MAKSKDSFRLTSMKHFSAGEFRRALAAARRGIAHYPDDCQLWQVRGTALRQLGRHRAAVRALETATTLGPLNPFTRCALADSYAAIGRTTLARDIYELIASEEGCPAEALPLLARGLGRVGANAQALGLCRRLIKSNPQNHRAWFGAGFYAARMGRDPRQVIRYVRRAHQLAPKVDAYRINVGVLEAVLGREGDCEMTLRGLSSRSLLSPDVLRGLVHTLRANGLAGLAARWQERLARLEPALPDDPTSRRRTS